MSANLVNNKYRITRRIGGGSFGEIYLGIGPSGEKVAVKFERLGSRCPQLRHEYKVYRELMNCHGFCTVYHFGTQDNYNVMVMDLLGPSLEDLFTKCGRKFSLKTVLQIADQLLERVDTLHARHLIHRDIKPANFVIGLGEQGANVYCVDFGLSKRYRHPKNLQHIPHRDGRSLTGTPRYASINNHLGVEQSRRDDLESIGYVLVYFLKGILPWQGLKAKNPQKKYRLIMEKKQSVSVAQLCQGLPSPFAEFLAYSRSLKFDAKPDVPYLRKLFRDLYHAQGCNSIAKLWDWDTIDDNYLMTAGTPANGPPAIDETGALVAQQPPLNAANNPGSQGQGADFNRPQTAMAVAQNFQEAAEYGQDSFKNAGERAPSARSGPSAAAAGTNAQQGNSWGFPGANGILETTGNHLASAIGFNRPSSAANGIAGGGNEAQPSGHYQQEPSRRPHTATGGRGGAANNGANMEQAPAGNGQQAASGDAVVAGARAMMRYRKTRASTTEAAAVIGSNIGKSWMGSSGEAPAAAPGYAGQTGQPARQSSMPGVAGQRSGSAGTGQGTNFGGSRKVNKGASQASGGGLVNGASNWLSGVSTGDRPKSAGFSGPANSGNRTEANNVAYNNSPYTAGGAPGNSQSNSASGLSYGALKSRFVTPSSNPSQPASGSGQKARSNSSKLFNLNR